MLKINTVVLSLVGLTLILGCAGGGKMQRTEQEYIPTHVAVGEVISYNIAQTMKNEDLVRFFSGFVEEALYDQDVRYIPQKELESTPVPYESTVMMNMEISFMESSRQGFEGEQKSVDVMITYSLKRRSDNFLWLDGSARASDLPNSEQALFDRTTGLEFAANSCVTKIKKSLEHDSE